MNFSSTSKPIISSDISSESLQKYIDEISSFPKENGWSSLMTLHSYQHFWFYSFFLEGGLHARDHFQPQPSDIFLCSPMKTGSTWLMALSFSIATRTRFDDSNSPLRNTVPHGCVPMLEFGEHYSIEGPKAPLFASHLPYTCLPKSIIDAGCKIVYLCRDPKDTFVSMWHYFRKMVEDNKITSEEIFASIEEAFELFCKGVSSYGPYWDHVLGYWEASLERPEKILFLKYEDMMDDTELYVKKLVDFFGCPFTLEEEKEGMIERIIEFCSFEGLSMETGDWRNYLSSEMGEQIDSIMEEKLGSSGLTFLKNHNK